MSTAKYVIRAKFEVDGFVEKPDIIGAIFGQTEGIFGSMLDLRELQKAGRIGRIEIELRHDKNKTFGDIIIPSNLDRPSTALLAATIETVDKVGPYSTKVELEKIEDLRASKRKSIIKRAKELLREWSFESTTTAEEVLREISETLATAEITEYGPEKLPAGPEVASSNSIIIVEGRADVINLLKAGYRNVIALNGARVPETVIKLCAQKEVTVFLDGDRSGDMILKQLLEVADIDFIARAPKGKEVEELTPKEIMKALRERTPAEKIARKLKQEEKILDQVVEALKEVDGTLEGIIFDKSYNRLAKIPVSELVNTLNSLEKAHAIVFDGVITQRLVDTASKKGVKLIVANRIADVKRPSGGIKLLLAEQVLKKQD